MSEPIATEAEVVADPVDALAVEATPDAKAADAPQTEPAALTEIEQAASKGGWVPKDQWTGPEDKWVDAPQFVLKAAEILPQLTKDLKEARDEIKAVKKAVAESAGFISKAEKRAYDQARRDLEARLDEAANNADAEGVRTVTKDLIDLEREVVAEPPPKSPAASPEFDAWQAANPWFGDDEALTAATVAIANKAETEGYQGKALIKEVDLRVRAKFPQLYSNPNRERAATVEGGGTQRPKAAKTLSDMPPEAREMVAYFKQSVKGFNTDKYVKDYFKEPAA